MTTDERITAGLPYDLTHTKAGTPRKRIARVAELPQETLSIVAEIRDQLLRLYAPARHAEPMAKVMVGIDAAATYTTGSRTWHKKQIGPTDFVDIPHDTPFLVVDDTGSEHWAPSMNAWIGHVMGGPSLLPRWDRGVDDLTSLLIDVDHKYGGDEREMVWHARTLARALHDVESMLGVIIPHQIMWTGNSGLWLHVHTNNTIPAVQAARFVAMLAGRWGRGEAEDRDREFMASQPSNYFSSRWVCVDATIRMDTGLDLNGIFKEKDAKRNDHFVSFDGGNLVTRPCRMPLARHRKSGGTAMFVSDEGEVIEDQIGYLMSIERSDLNLGEAVERFWSERGYPAQTTNIDTIGEIQASTRDSDGGADEGTALATEERDALEAMRTPIPEGRWVITVETLRAGTAPVPTSVEQILPRRIHDVDFHRTLIARRPGGGNGLLKLYSLLRSEGTLSERNVVDLIMARSASLEPGRRRKIERMVSRDFQRGVHMWEPRSEVHPCISKAESAASGAGITNPIHVDLLIALTHRGWTTGTARTIHEDLARQIGILAPMEVDPPLVKRAKQNVGNYLKRLMAAGLIWRTKKGSPEHRTPSSYRLLFHEGAMLLGTRDGGVCTAA
jgi:hypothetical protein